MHECSVSSAIFGVVKGFASVVVVPQLALPPPLSLECDNFLRTFLRTVKDTVLGVCYCSVHSGCAQTCPKGRNISIGGVRGGRSMF